jgi:tetratricopeptide (TPR) repeat protein
MHRWILLLLLIPSSVFAQNLDDAEWAQMAYKEGRQYEKDRDWENALRRYEAAVAREPKVEEYRYRAAHAATQLKTVEKAKTLLKPTLSQEHAPSWNLYATLLLQQEEIDEAREWFQKALLLDPGNPNPYFGLAACADADAKSGDLAAKSHAIAHYQAYLGRAPDGSQRYQVQKRLRILRYGEEGGIPLNQAIGVLKTGQYGRAERMLKKLTPDLEKESFYWLGVIARQRKDLATAQRHWEVALPFPAAHLALAQGHMAVGKYEEALPHLESAKNRAPDRVEVSLALGRVYLELHRTEDAKNELRRVVRDAPQRPEWSRAQALLGQIEETTSVPEADWPVGRLTEAQLLERYGGEVYDAVQQDRLEALIQRLRAGTPELASRRFEVRILKSVVPNAWPLPPNKILITQGLIQFVNASAELQKVADDVLAFILGHEITHLIEGDTEHASELQGLIGGNVTDFRVRQAILHRTEYKADRRGTLIAYQAQFDPFAAVLWCRASGNRYGDSPEGSRTPPIRVWRFNRSASPVQARCESARSR